MKKLTKQDFIDAEKYARYAQLGDNALNNKVYLLSCYMNMSIKEIKAKKISEICILLKELDIYLSTYEKELSKPINSRFDILDL